MSGYLQHRIQNGSATVKRYQLNINAKDEI